MTADDVVASINSLLASSPRCRLARHVRLYMSLDAMREWRAGDGWVPWVAWIVDDRLRGLEMRLQVSA